jgi:tetratricopeptide (TPR) repeat protein
MYRNDYVMRMIYQLGAIIRYVFGLQQKGDYTLALIAIDNAYRDRLGLGADDVGTLADRELLALVRFGGGEAWREEGLFVAALLHAEAAIYTAQERGDAAAERALRALQLLAECAIDADGPLPDYAPPRNELLGMLRDYHLPGHTRAALFTICERDGDFATAENLLGEMLDEHPDDPELHAAGSAFYSRLLALNDAALQQGGVTRSEVEEALGRMRGAG